MNTMISVAVFIGVPLSILFTLFAIKFAGKVDHFLGDLVSDLYLLPDTAKAIAKDFILALLFFTGSVVAIIATAVLLILAQ